MDRAGTLRTAAASWFAARGVAEVVLVDWSSAAPAVLALPRSLRSDSRLVVVRVEGQREWALSRAYNLGVQLASRAVVLKVDCDTHLHSDFLQRHPLRAGEFYAGDWRALRTPLSEKLHVNGLLLARRDDILAVGGYDERITTYGWDDSDVALRLSATREHLRFDYASVAHLVHPAALRVSHQRRAALLAPGHPLAAAVEIQRNRLLLTRFNLPAWRARSPHTVWDVETRSSPHARAGPGVFGRAARVTPSRERLPLVLVASAASEVASATELVSDADALDVAKRAIRVVLQRYGTPALPKTLTLPFYKTLLTKVAYPTRYAETALALRGGCLSRLLAHSAALVVSSASEAGSAQAPGGSAALFEHAAQSPPTGFIGWRVRQYWNFPNTECGCRFFDAFQAKRSEISAAWPNNAEKVRFVAYRAGLLPTDVRAVLSSFKTHATPKNLTADVAEWTAAAAVSSNASAARRPPRILLAQLACDVAPRDVSAAHAQAMRAVLRELVPTEQVRAAVLRSLQTPNGTVLDNPELQERAWTDLLGPDAAKQLNAVFASAAMRDMARAWGAGAVSEERLLFHLHRRAAALVVAMRINGNKEARGKIFERLDEGRRTDLRAVVDHLEVRFRSLFHECPDHASRYLDAYPELAMVVAGLLSANFCMT